MPEGVIEFELSAAPTPARELVRGLWRARTLLAILARKDFFVRYRRASLGLAWAIILPLVQAAVLAVVLSRFVKFHTPVNYTVFVYSGTLAWNYFSSTLIAGAGSIVDGQELSTKVYFPRSIFPLVPVASGLYGLGLSVVVMLVLALAVGAGIGLRVLLLLPAVAATVLLTAGASLVLGVVQVYFRDMRYIVQAALMAWFYVTPVFYPLNAVGRLRRLVAVNPASGMVELYRAGTVGADHGWAGAVIWTVAWSVVFFLAAVALYRGHDRVCTDLL
jgi:ABC-type polysaccharide/polyol phosphate export permease